MLLQLPVELLEELHWEYHATRCKMSSILVWKHLIESPRTLAYKVRCLEFLDERCPSSEERVPRAIHELIKTYQSSRVDADDFFIKALGKMDVLKIFKWTKHTGLHLDKTYLMDCIWPILTKLRTLDHLGLHNDNWLHYREDITDTETSITSLNLESTSRLYDYYKHRPYAIPEPGAKILNQCPNLKSLQIE
ncbi:hypothetical protein BDQ17DRAFT_1428931 [Cyathus striatus]|nr:hypothetical protein BDQ17DRAFT_1428931 [Cyathus striatus]